jgi:hypothetical protein
VSESDPLLRRVERNGVIACLVIAAAAWMLARGRLTAPAGVIAGGAIVAISYRGIKAGTDALVGGGLGSSRWAGRQAVIGLVKFFTRYAILAGASYVVMARLELPPLAVVAGVLSLVVAVLFEALSGVTPGRR